VSYTPNALEDVNGFVDQRAARANGWSPGLNYTNTLMGIRVAASAGLTYYPEIDGAAANTANGNAIKDWSAGLNLGFGAFTVGGGYRVIDNNLGTNDGSVWSVGGAYQAGPIAVSASYLQSTANGTVAVGDDVVKQTILSAAYTMGPGVDLVGSIFSMSYKDEGGAATNNNSGSGGVVGIRLMF
jgi:predicted porin